MEIKLKQAIVLGFGFALGVELFLLAELLFIVLPALAFWVGFGMNSR